MSKTNKTLCKWKKKDIENQPADFMNLVRDSRYVCIKCGRTAVHKKRLCRPADMYDGVCAKEKT